ncbi:MAG: integrase arm-type DNA-binding domain-containing protein [Moraxellaceae bacterium]
MAQLKQQQLASIVKAGKAGSHSDGGGLFLKLNGKGAANWMHRYQMNGKRRDMGLGSYPLVSLADARAKVAESRKLIADGIDPITERDRLAALKAYQAANGVTFEQMAAQYLEGRLESWKNQKHRQQWENTLATYAYPVIGQKSVQDISTADMLKILQPIWQNKPETANRVRGRIESILRAAKALKLRTGDNPAEWQGNLESILPRYNKKQVVKHHPAMPYNDLPMFIQELRQHATQSAKALHFLILTACRTSEVCNARWDEINREANLWTIPAHRMKAKKEHRIPLTAAMLALLDSLERIESNPHIFTGMKAGRPISTATMHRLFTHYMGYSQYTVHGFRSTFRDWAGECTHHPRDVCEQALAHTLTSAVEASYRRGDLLEKRRRLMDEWTAYATAPVDHSNLVRFKIGA